jgi:transcriptional regulator with XRE-family HTH domain
VDGSRVAELRKRAGKTQAELARDAGVSLMHLSAIERGAADNPTLATLTALAVALNCSIGDLLGEPKRVAG